MIDRELYDAGKLLMNDPRLVADIVEFWRKLPTGEDCANNTELLAYILTIVRNHLTIDNVFGYDAVQNWADKHNYKLEAL